LLDLVCVLVRIDEFIKVAAAHNRTIVLVTSVRRRLTMWQKDIQIEDTILDMQQDPVGVVVQYGREEDIHAAGSR
jgi:hypothetical protein